MRLSRRGFLISGLVGGTALLSGAGAVRSGAPDTGSRPDAAGGEGENYVTMPGVPRPELKVRRHGSTTPGLLLVTPFRGRDDADALIVDDRGEPVWINRSGRLVTDLRVQTYEGEPVLTYWQGERRSGGYGDGVGIVLGRDYRRVAEVRAGNGVHADFHEFLLTDRGTALIIAYPEVTADMRPIGGPRNGRVLDNRVQEIDVRTGEILFDWSALEHLDITETLTPLREGADGGPEGQPFDPIHVNSIQDDGDTLLLSARNSCTLYLLDRRTGAVRWRMGGRRSDFPLEGKLRFAWQHDARWLPDGTLSLFDNHITEQEKGLSRGMVLDVDEDARKVRLVREFSDGRTFGHYMANLQLLPGGNALVGWGSTGSVTEFAGDGRPVLEVSGVGNGSYRAYRSAWSGRPAADPAVVAEPVDDERMRVHVSWNGATGVTAWRFHTGSEPSRLAVADTVRRSGFETAATVPRARYVAAEALAAGGSSLGRSAPRAV
ncbi:arylsulfotransferase family protein [Actinomadura welshii]